MRGVVATIETPSGYPVPLTWIAGEPGAPVILLMAALGVGTPFYAGLGAELAGQGFQVALMEQRGHGDSRLRPSRRSDWGFADTLDNDLPAVMDWLRQSAPGAPLYLMGHSLGGHYAAITAGRFPERIAGVILVATGTPWWKAFQGETRKMIHRLVRIIPFANFAFGYYPGERIGFGGSEARTVMRDWRNLARTNRYSAHGLAADLDTDIARYGGPVLAVRLADDVFAPRAAVQAVTGKFKNATLTEQVLTAEALGDKADHFRWARQASVVTGYVAEWIKADNRAGS